MTLLLAVCLTALGAQAAADGFGLAHYRLELARMRMAGVALSPADLPEGTGAAPDVDRLRALREAAEGRDAAAVLARANDLLDAADQIDRAPDVNAHLAATSARAAAAQIVADVPPLAPGDAGAARALIARLRDDAPSDAGFGRAMDAARVRHFEGFRYLFTRGGRAPDLLQTLGTHDKSFAELDAILSEGKVEWPTEVGLRLLRPWLWWDALRAGRHPDALRRAVAAARTPDEYRRLAPPVPERAIWDEAPDGEWLRQVWLARARIAGMFTTSLRRAGEAEVESRLARHAAADALARRLAEVDGAAARRAGSQVAGHQARVPADAGQHLGADLLAVVEREDVVRPTLAFEHAVRGAALPLD